MTPTSLPPAKRTYETPQPVVTKGTEPPFRLHRGTALRHENGDVYIVIGCVYLRPTGLRPDMHSVILERDRDKKKIERTVETIKEQMDEKKMKRVDELFDNRSKVRIEMDEKRMIVHTVDM